MSNWPKDTTKGTTMTEDQVRRIVREELAAQSKPAEATEPVKDLRWLVERHECLSGVLEWRGVEGSKYLWHWYDESNNADCICTAKTLTVVRGIVKSMCDEHGGSWSPTGQDVYPQLDNRWYHHWRGKNHYLTTELEAIDALLTAMEEAK